MHKWSGGSHKFIDRSECLYVHRKTNKYCKHDEIITTWQTFLHRKREFAHSDMCGNVA